MLDFDLLKSILIISIASGTVATLLIQKIKENLKSKKYIFIISLLVNLIIGTAFALSFSDISLIYAIWCGIFGIVDSSVLYQMLEDKIFKSYSNLDKTIRVEIKDDENE